MGQVPEYECREVARFYLYNWIDWTQLHWFDRASAVAYYRIHHLLEAHVHDAVDKQHKLNQLRARRKRGK